jgi:glycosyltransferase involved in cell wall biosynthesis
MPRVLVNLLQTTGSKGGIEVYARELYRAIGALDSGFDFVGYASTELAGADTSWFPGTIVDSGISGENRLAWARGELFSVARAARAQKVDLLHGPAMFGPLRLALPSVITVHDLLYFSHPELMQTKIFTGPVKWMERRGAAGATRLITISEYSAAAIRRYLRFPSEAIDVIPLAARAGAKAAHGQRARRGDLFLAMGQRSPYKNFETIVRAWARIPQPIRPRLVITGGGADDPLRPLVDELGLAEWIDLRVWVSTEELSDLIATATALIDSTLATGFSLPAVEAMRAGLPVILADTAIFREVGGDAADYFAAGDPVALAAAVQALGSDPARQKSLTALGVRRAARTSWAQVAERTLESFERAIAQHARA